MEDTGVCVPVLRLRGDHAGGVGATGGADHGYLHCFQQASGRAFEAYFAAGVADGVSDCEGETRPNFRINFLQVERNPRSQMSDLSLYDGVSNSFGSLVGSKLKK